MLCQHTVSHCGKEDTAAVSRHQGAGRDGPRQLSDGSTNGTANPRTETGGRRTRFRAGDRVVVRPPEEILRTLDADGTLGGLPFMPEMLEWCGKPFRVERRAEKTCVDVRKVYSNRHFADDDVVFLEGPRCDGSAHDGCKRGCKIFWKEAWLRPVDSADASEPPPAALDRLRRRLKTKTDQSHYLCQSTQLYQATAAVPGNTKVWLLRVVIREIRNGDRGAVEIMRLLGPWVMQRLARRVRGDRMRGPHERAPVATLGLQPGDAVRVKSREEITATLDRRGTNKGLGICAEMTRCSGARAEVDFVVDRIIDERTGQMREIRNTVALRDFRSPKLTRDPECLCANELGDCPRSELMYWREIWLERARPPRTGKEPGVGSATG